MSTIEQTYHNQLSQDYELLWQLLMQDFQIIAFKNNKEYRELWEITKYFFDKTSKYDNFRYFKKVNLTFLKP